ncbi:hypothetical protein BU14_0745s0001 [Porphyra umbilicalis]|uniref:Uncharacterized protein n=1 Tax=Porphyra umbilicalis TaxID=2786 RepID=A0A1X6NQ30_PORUM|nr:hypothetical protein BU14_0745s0001 [Porphyra umbilicalis]|eukprot:OSX70473.1 hypothetical protein BU14_0745s0001 [Porphyra umbilicalis]
MRVLNDARLAEWLFYPHPRPAMLSDAIPMSFMIHSTRTSIAPQRGHKPGGRATTVGRRRRSEGRRSPAAGQTDGPSARGVGGVGVGGTPSRCGARGGVTPGGGVTGRPHSGSPASAMDLPTAPLAENVTVAQTVLAPHTTLDSRWVLSSVHMSVSILDAVGWPEELTPHAGNAVLDLETGGGHALFFLWYNPGRLVVVYAEMGSGGAGSGCFYLLKSEGLATMQGDAADRVAALCGSGALDGRTLLAGGWSEGGHCQYCHWRSYACDKDRSDDDYIRGGGVGSKRRACSCDCQPELRRRGWEGLPADVRGGGGGNGVPDTAPGGGPEGADTDGAGRSGWGRRGDAHAGEPSAQYKSGVLTLSRAGYAGGGGGGSSGSFGSLGDMLRWSSPNSVASPRLQRFTLRVPGETGDRVLYMGNTDELYGPGAGDCSRALDAARRAFAAATVRVYPGADGPLGVGMGGGGWRRGGGGAGGCGTKRVWVAGGGAWR